MDVQTVSVACNNCGAALDVRGDTRFATCTYCGSRLAVHRSGGAAYTEVLDEIRRTTQGIADDVGTLRVQAELETLDREWSIRREPLLQRDKHGGTSVPTHGGSVAGGVFTVVFAVVWMVFAGGVVGAPAPFVLFGLVFAGFGVFTAAAGVRKAEAYARAEQAYLRKREAVLARLARRQAEGGDGGLDDGGPA